MKTTVIANKYEGGGVSLSVQVAGPDGRETAQEIDILVLEDQVLVYVSRDLQRNSGITPEGFARKLFPGKIVESVKSTHCRVDSVEEVESLFTKVVSTLEAWPCE